MVDPKRLRRKRTKSENFRRFKVRFLKRQKRKSPRMMKRPTVPLKRKSPRKRSQEVLSDLGTYHTDYEKNQNQICFKIYFLVYIRVLF